MDLLSATSSLDIIFGPMFSGKTTELVRRLTILAEAGLKVIYVNSVLDSRDNVVSTHNHSTIALNVASLHGIKTDKLFDLKDSVKDFDVIGIDESQFFSDLKSFCLYTTETLRKKVLIAGLNGDFKREEFGQINSLIPYCDTITKLYPFCMSCSKKKILRAALFSKRIQLENQSEAQIQIGASEAYIAVCRECYTH
jgi:thymidine kinase